MVDRDRLALWRDLAVAIAVAGVIFALSYAGGGYDISTRAYAGIAAWWVLGVGAAVGLGAVRTRLDRFALWALALFAAFAVWTLISVAWAPDAERAFDKFDQVSLYVAILAIAIVLGRTVSAYVVVTGATLGLSGVAAVALVSRLFPSVFGTAPGSNILNLLEARLSFPLGYWNGLGIEVALAYPVLLAIMTSRRSPAVRALAVLPLPVLAADLYFTSSRGAFVAAIVAVVAYVAITPRRWSAVAAIVLAAIEAAVAIAVIKPKTALVDVELSNPVAISEGHHVALVVGIAAVLGALVWYGINELIERRPIPQPPRIAGYAVTALFVVLVVVAIALSHPVWRFNQFRSPNFGNYGSTNQTFVEQHLLSSSGSGRWQFWGAAISQFKEHPLQGGGAGSWFYFWLQHKTSIYSLSAHSLYLEALGELGIVGFLLILGAVLVALVGAVRAARALVSAEIAAAAAVAIAFFVAAAYDWVWDLAGITVVGMGMVGVALGASPIGELKPWRRESIVRPVVALAAVGAVIAQFVVLSATLHLRNSYAADKLSDAKGATAQALAAKALEPWAATPYLQLGELAQAEGQYKIAHRWLMDAIKRSPLDSNLWATAAHIDVLGGRIPLAERELVTARKLYPTNPLLTATNG
jgi:hypothetical protein